MDFTMNDPYGTMQIPRIDYIPLTLRQFWSHALFSLQALMGVQEVPSTAILYPSLQVQVKPPSVLRHNWEQATP